MHSPLAVVAHAIPAMLAYWDVSQRCRFSNAAYKTWFGRTPAEMANIEMKDLLGGLYSKNLPYIEGVLAGERQVFERQIPLPDGTVRETLATYLPDIVNGQVQGFSVHVSDVTLIRQREQDVREALRGTIETLRATKRSFRSKELAELREKLEFFLGK